MSSAAVDDQPTKRTAPTVNEEGTVRLPEVSIPYSDLASPQAKENYLQFVRGMQRVMSRPDLAHMSIGELRKILDEAFLIPGVERLRAIFPVKIDPKVIAGVKSEVITPSGGVPLRNRDRVLIALHAGGFMTGGLHGARMESIPIAALGGFKVIAVDYRMAPENRFPAATEDVEEVYRELLKTYRPENIGLYGCSAGAHLTAQAVARFQSNGLPRPGALGMFGGGAVIDHWGDGNYAASALAGSSVPMIPAGGNVSPYFSGENLSNPNISPGYSDSFMSQFPSSLVITSTRDPAMSIALYTHRRLSDLSVDTALHVFEGTPHCFFAQPIVDATVPETRQAWNVIVRFFDKHLGARSK